MDEERTYDIRTLERNFEKGLITKKEYEKFLKGLDDVEGNAEIISASFDPDQTEEEE